MTYQDILDASEKILSNLPDCDFSNVTIITKLESEKHYKLDYELFNKMNNNKEFEHSEIIDVNVNGIMFKFIQKDKKIFVE